MTETGYPHRFINQYARVPQDILARLDAEFPGEYPGVRHCLGLILTNLLGYGPVAYSRRGEFYTKNRTLHYTRANMLRAVDIADERGYATSRKGFRSEGYSKGVSSILSSGEKLRKKFRPVASVPLDPGLPPILVIDGRVFFEGGDPPSAAWGPLSLRPSRPPPPHTVLYTMTLTGSTGGTSTGCASATATPDWRASTSRSSA